MTDELVDRIWDALRVRDRSPSLVTNIFDLGFVYDKVGSDTNISAAKTIKAQVGDHFARYGLQER